MGGIRNLTVIRLVWPQAIRLLLLKTKAVSSHRKHNLTAAFEVETLFAQSVCVGSAWATTDRVRNLTFDPCFFLFEECNNLPLSSPAAVSRRRKHNLTAAFQLEALFAQSVFVGSAWASVPQKRKKQKW